MAHAMAQSRRLAGYIWELRVGHTTRNFLNLAKASDAFEEATGTPVEQALKGQFEQATAHGKPLPTLAEVPQLKHAKATLRRLSAP